MTRVGTVERTAFHTTDRNTIKKKTHRIRQTIFLIAARATARVACDDSLLHALLSGCRNGDGTIGSTLQMTIKAHKADGEVGPGAIHASPQHPMAPGLRWLSQNCRMHLKTFFLTFFMAQY